MHNADMRAPEDLAIFPFGLHTYGTSVEGVPLRYLPAGGRTDLLVFAGIHGEEPETTFLLSRTLRMLKAPPAHVACILAANPDGLLRGTRGNARGVDLNRNFPASNWSASPVFTRFTLESPRITELSPGDAPGSEPEVQALVKLIRELRPGAAVALHSPIGCVDSEARTPLSASLERLFLLPWNKGVGYETPGSFGSFSNDTELGCVTLELPRESPEALSRFAEPFAEFLAAYGADGK